tara:strand:+ start:784 stop:990 length:207 start_codon:yes stop_codon:yes gene_type:complete
MDESGARAIKAYFINPRWEDDIAVPFLSQEKRIRSGQDPITYATIVVRIESESVVGKEERMVAAAVTL